MDQLVSGSNTLTQKSSSLTAGVGQLVEKTPKLVSSIEKLSTGSNQLNRKSQELIAGVDKLQNDFFTFYVDVTGGFIENV